MKVRPPAAVPKSIRPRFPSVSVCHVTGSYLFTSLPLIHRQPLPSWIRYVPITLFQALDSLCLSSLQQDLTTRRRTEQARRSELALLPRFKTCHYPMPTPLFPSPTGAQAHHHTHLLLGNLKISSLTACT